MALSFDAVRRVLRHVGQLALLRADLAAEELALARQRWLGWVIAALAGTALLAVAIAAAGAWLTLELWDRFGAGTLGVLAILLGAGGALLLYGLTSAIDRAPSALAQPRAALHEDYEALAAVTRPSDEAEPKV